MKTIKAGDKKPGEWIESNGIKYLIVEDGKGEFGIRNDEIRDKIINGSLKVCTTYVTDMSRMFDEAYTFNQPIGDWDTSNVTDMNGMFKRAHAMEERNKPKFKIKR